MKIKEYCRKSGKTKVELAQMFEISRQTLYNILSGEMPSAQTIKQIARATNKAVTFDDF